MKNEKSTIDVTEVYPDNVSLTFLDCTLLGEVKSKFQHIEVYNHRHMGKLLLIDKMLMFSEKDYKNNREMMVNISLHCRGTFDNILVIGGGDGSSPGEAVKYPFLKSIDVVDIDKEVSTLCGKHFDFIKDAFCDKRAHYFFEEGSEFIRNNTGKKEYGAIIVSPTDPDSISLPLFQKDFFQNCYDILDSDGIFCIGGFTPYYNLGKINPKNVYNELNDVFKIVNIFITSLPTYPGGLCSYLIASKGLDPSRVIHKPLERDEYEKMEYYNFDIHSASFAIPNNIKRLFFG
jgi:spermidine synthase